MNRPQRGTFIVGILLVALADKQRLAYIDGLRLIGAGAVVAQHLFERIAQPWARAVIAPAPGVFGVVLFFMISGFVIPFSTQRGLNICSFAIRRVMRIYPVYLLVLALALVAGVTGVAPYFRTITEAGPRDWIANLLLIQDFVGAHAFYSVSWTLAIELIWYALFVVMMKVAGARAGRSSALIAPAVMLFLTIVSLMIGIRIPLGRPGMIYAAVLGYQTFRWHQGEIGKTVWQWNVAAFLAVTLVSNSVAFGYFHHPKISLLQAIGPWSAALALFVVTVSVPAIRGPYGLSRPLVAAIGATSYSIYMMHPLAIAVAVHLGTPLLVIPAALILTVVMAMLSYRWIELPGIALGRSLSGRRRILPPLAAAAS